LVDERHYNPNLTDLKFIKCPLCDKDIVKGRWHGCKALLHSDEYVNEVRGIRLLWHPTVGWRSYKFPKGTMIVSLSFADVFNLTRDDENFLPVGNWEVSPAVKNIY
jgi:hypothetical protein